LGARKNQRTMENSKEDGEFDKAVGRVADGLL